MKIYCLRCAKNPAMKFGVCIFCAMSVDCKEVSHRVLKVFLLHDKKHYWYTDGFRSFGVVRV